MPRRNRNAGEILVRGSRRSFRFRRPATVNPNPDSIEVEDPFMAIWVCEHCGEGSDSNHKNCRKCHAKQPI